MKHVSDLFGSLPEPKPLAAWVNASLQLTLDALEQAGFLYTGIDFDGEPLFESTYAVNEKGFDHLASRFQGITQMSALAGLYLVFRAPRLNEDGWCVPGRYTACKVFGPCMADSFQMDQRTPFEVVVSLKQEVTEPEADHQANLTASTHDHEEWNKSPSRQSGTGAKDYSWSPQVSPIRAPFQGDEEDDEDDDAPISQDWRTLLDEELMVSLSPSAPAFSEDDMSTVSSASSEGEEILWTGRALRDAVATVYTEKTTQWVQRVASLGEQPDQDAVAAVYHESAQMWTRCAAAMQGEDDTLFSDADADEVLYYDDFEDEDEVQDAREAAIWEAALRDPEEAQAELFGQARAPKGDSLYGAQCGRRAHARRGGYCHNAGFSRHQGLSAIY